MKVAWQPNKGQQTKALQRTEREILYGGARGGGKTDAGMAWLLRWIDNPRYRALIIRTTEKDLRDWIERAKVMYAGTGAVFANRPTEIRFPSGAMFFTGHLNDSNAYTQYQGHEYQKMLIEELTLIPSEELYLKLKASNRSTVNGLSPQLFATTNPSEIGHLWVKNRFVDVAVPEETYIEHDSETGLDLTRVFIPARVEDNPVLMEKDPEYVAMLNKLPSDLRRAWREGSWDVFETRGAYYSKDIAKARKEKRICKLPVEDNLPIRTTWDLGINDYMAIWAFQIYSKEIRWIGYFEGDDEDILYYLNLLDEKYGKDNLGTFYFPHDVVARSAASKRSCLDVAQDWGIIDYEIADREDPLQRVNATRILFPQFFFDEEKCSYGLSLLNQYRKKYDEKNDVFLRPVHDKSSHCADAIGTFAQCYDEIIASDYETPYDTGQGGRLA